MDEPTLKSPTSGNVVDFYGSCNETPTDKIRSTPRS